MKSNNPYSFFPSYVLRTPTLPLDRSLEHTIETYWQHPVFKEALYLASPELYAEVEKGLDQNKLNASLRYALLKYILRITNRCTPFGLFAGCSVGQFSKETSLKLATVKGYNRQTRFDMHFVVAWAQQLAKEPDIKKQLHWYPNNSLYKIGDQYRYVEYTYTKHNRREHSLEAVTHTPYLQKIIENAQNGTTVNELADLLVDDEITLDDALQFIDQLIDNQILVSQLEPTLTGEDFLMQIQTTLNQLEGTDAYVTFIKDLNGAIQDIDSTIGNPIEKYLTTNKIITDKGIDYEPKFLFQADLYPKAINNQLDQKWGYKTQRLLTALNKITFPSKDKNIDRFRSAFTKRYETREVPLTTALDTEIGIGYLQHQEASDSTPFLQGLNIPFSPSTSEQYQANLFHELLYKKLEDADLILELTDEDLIDFEADWSDLPDTMATMTELVTINGEEKMVCESIGGSSAANLLGRFTTGADDIYSLVRDITEKEQHMNPDSILAEIIHLPESRTGNVIRRANLRAYEIPYLGKSSVANTKQIPIEDLMIAVRGNTIILRSKKLNKRILPRLSNAHNYSAKSLPIYHFLCDLQHQNLRSGLAFSWGPILQKRPFLPRVIYKDFILAKARWIIPQKNIKAFLKLSDEDLIASITDWSTELNIPNLAQLVEGDNTLLIDFKNLLSIKMWLDTIKHKKQIILEEFLFTEDSLVTQNNKGFSNQIVISFYNQEKLKQYDN
ncbi:lantibiotic dehydratase family protein [Aquimarina brevivitae]|uniref:Lantibiotic biosynthesis dehydratase-like protein n=1 Tax=Aquimarina brevivitae TaxID=323412 RepID=A0A4Q7PG19_9FLAO|nr:lantibiotic dehydratase family protein [Aquimarina brevivitae]RZS99431.1 lantibiotic biosynthesis dehydratase-like protein [Aquimarina brevivitae]